MASLSLSPSLIKIINYSAQISAVREVEALSIEFGSLQFSKVPSSTPSTPVPNPSNLYYSR